MADIKGDGGNKGVGRDSAYYVNAEGVLVPVPVPVPEVEPVVEEFHNQCHDEDDGKFCEGDDGPGRVREKVGYSGLGKLVSDGKGGFVDRKTGVRYGTDGKVVGEVNHGKVSKAIAGEIPDPPGAEKEQRGLISRVLKAIGIDRTDDVHSITERVVDLFNEGAGPKEPAKETMAHRLQREKREKALEKAQAKGEREARLAEEYARRTGNRPNAKFLKRRGIG